MREKLRTIVSSGFVVHLVELGLAAIPAAAAASFLAETTAELGADVAGRDAYVEALAAASHGRASSALYGLAIVAASMLVLHAPVQMVWLHALAGSRGRAATRAGLARVRPALGVTFLVCAAGLLFASAALCPAIAAHLVLRDHVDVRIHDLAVLAMAAPVAIVVYAAAMVHDLARSALVAPARDAPTAIHIAVRALEPRLALRYGLYLLASTTVVSLATLASFLGGNEQRAALALFVAHALLFVRTMLRGAWLARCVAWTSGSEAFPEPDVDPRAADQTARLAG